MSAARSEDPRAGGRRPGLRSLTNKVALLFAGVVVLAFAVVYFYIVPQLRSNLEQQVLDELAGTAADSAPAIEAVMDTDDPGPEVDALVQQAADEVEARVTLLGIQRSAAGSGSFYTISDSNFASPSVLRERSRGQEGKSARDPAPAAGARAPAGKDGRPDGEGSLLEPPGGGEELRQQEGALPTPDVSLSVAGSASDRGRVQTGLGRSQGDLVAQAAAPLRESRRQPPEWVAVYSRPIEDISEAVGLIRRQVLVAGLLAVLVALAGGWLVARAVARRVRRLESAAKEFAEGTSVTPLPIDSEDELGQLTRTFNEMQEQRARADRARRDFIANASHELRTPIFSLGGFAELIQDEELDHETRERFLASMREQIDRLKRLAADLLDLSRLDAGALDIHAREVDVAEVVEGVAQEFAPTTAERGTPVAIDLPRGGLEAWCDPDRVAQIVRILLDNALRHNAEGTPVRLSGGRRDGAVEVCVADAGSGLDPDSAERVFERFYTGDPARGSGLGLAIARELAERMNGRILLRSEPDQTVFALILPLPADRNGDVRDGSPWEAPASRASASR